ncbi:hypothetical protein [Robertkochia sediminum]|uniref:hypothetical protein n=1 Tax=Robertkochia sediminum TaxID=2785326 RepID=UPI0019311D56|nr:hypothetical protein [Robertkochia sediminum]MBL7473360.1 hypothetical protein [Robertkochia sediminum]
MINKELDLYIQLIMKKLVLETQGEVSNRHYCDPFKMRVHLQGILGHNYRSEQYHNAIEYINRHQYARYGGMYLTEKGAQYVDRLMSLQQRRITLSSMRRKTQEPVLVPVA